MSMNTINHIRHELNQTEQQETKRKKKKEKRWSLKGFPLCLQQNKQRQSHHKLRGE